jgi:hypothetical protein
MNVFVQDVLDDTISMVSWVWLDVNTFNWIVHLDVSHGDISHTLMVGAWWNGTDSHTYGVNGMNVFSEDVFGTFGNLVTFISWFWNDSIIEVGNLKSSESNIS